MSESTFETAVAAIVTALGIAPGQQLGTDQSLAFAVQIDQARIANGIPQ
ncbi:MAG: hypothetical protein KGH90_07105 [Xanthomonadaceae bacterium]|nr:hypothetical protein [Xanthomonadaceae bacterium]